MLKRKHNRREWDDIRKLDLCPQVTSFEVYKDFVTKGEAAAAVRVLMAPTEIPSIGYIQDLHREVFQSVYPWAGSFNTEGEDVWFGGMLACDPRLIVEELTRLAGETEQLLSGKSDEAIARAIAYYHAKFERIHPFKDGNGRVGRLLMDAQINSLIRPDQATWTLASYTPYEYYRVLKWAQRRGNLKPLMNLIRKLAGKDLFSEEHDRLPFRLSPRRCSPEKEKARRRRAKNR